MRWIVLLLVMLSSAAHGADRITVDRAEPDVKRVKFNPFKPPAEMPPLKPDESAYCSFHFSYVFHWQYRTTQRTALPQGRWKVMVVPDTGKATLGLNVTLWLPWMASSRLIAHEEGHQRIAERVYMEAERDVRKLIFEALGKGTAGEGTSESEAVQSAIDALNDRIGEAYLKATAHRTQRISDVYDELTDHGRKRSPSEDEAIKTAFHRDMVRTGETPVSR